MEFCRRSGGWSCAVIAVLWSSAVPAVGVDCPSFQTGRQIGTVQLAAIDEASGLVASRKNPGVLWAHNDSGDSARTLAMVSSIWARMSPLCVVLPAASIEAVPET